MPLLSVPRPDPNDKILLQEPPDSSDLPAGDPSCFRFLAEPIRVDLEKMGGFIESEGCHYPFSPIFSHPSHVADIHLWRKSHSCVGVPNLSGFIILPLLCKEFLKSVRT